MNDYKKYLYDKLHKVVVEYNPKLAKYNGFVGIVPRKTLPLEMTSGWLYTAEEWIGRQADTIDDIIDNEVNDIGYVDGHAVARLNKKGEWELL